MKNSSFLDTSFLFLMKNPNDPDIFFITSWNLVKKPPLVIGHTEGKAFICSLCASCMILKLYFLCSIFRVAIKFPFGGQYEYAKTNKTAISSLVRLLFFIHRHASFKHICLQPVPWDDEKFRVQISRSFSKLSQTSSTLQAEHL